MTTVRPTFDQPGVTWSLRVQGVRTGRILLDHQPGTSLPTASIGKILLLLTVAEQILEGGLDPAEPLSRASVAPVADSGVWQHLRTDTLPVADAALLVAAVSDNLATNVLLHRVGLSAVEQTTTHLALSATGLHDLVRDARTSDHPPALSSGNAAELVRLCRDIELGRALSVSAATQVREWLSSDTDLSMVASAFGLDPLAHTGEDRGLTLWNKTGTNVGVRCDIGVVGAPGRDDLEPVAYAVLAQWTPADSDDPTRDDVLDAMRQVGRLVSESLS